MKTFVSFDKTSQGREACNSSESFDVAATRRKVLLRALHHDTPQLYRIVKQMCQAVSTDANGKHIPLKFVDRLLNATQLIHAEKVDLQAMQVLSPRSDSPYQLAFGGIPKQWFCTCPDFAKGGYPSIAYGPVCEHVLAVMLLRFLGSKTPQATYDSQADFVQGMTARQARRMTDPAYAEALTRGEEGPFWYQYHEILREYPLSLYRRAQAVLRIRGYKNWCAIQQGQISEQSKSTTAREVLSQFVTGYRFWTLFEIPELNGEDYGGWWEQLWTFAHNGQLARLKAELIEAYRSL